MEIETRDARKDDAALISWVQITAARSHLSRGLWDLVFDETEEERLDDLAAVVTARSRSFCHWSRFRVAEADGVPAAALSGYEPAKVSDQLLITALQEAGHERGWPPEFFENLGEAFAPFLTCIEPPPEDHWVVEWVATREAFRGKGLIRRLLLEMLERGRERGYRHAQISLLIGNDAANRAYEAVGFRLFDERESSEFESVLGSPGIRRLRMPL